MMLFRMAIRYSQDTAAYLGKCIYVLCIVHCLFVVYSFRLQVYILVLVSLCYVMLSYTILYYSIQYTLYNTILYTHVSPDNKFDPVPGNIHGVYVSAYGIGFSSYYGADCSVTGCIGK